MSYALCMLFWGRDLFTPTGGEKTRMGKGEKGEVARAGEGEGERERGREGRRKGACERTPPSPSRGQMGKAEMESIGAQ